MAEEWFTGERFREIQPFQTLARTWGGSRAIRKHLRKLVGNPAEHTALEVGPGDAPLIHALDFHHATFLEASPALASALERTLQNSRTRHSIVVGDARTHEPQERYGVIVLPELLTHLRESERLRVVRKFAGATDRLMIVDRPRGSVEELAKKILRELKHQNPEDPEQEIPATPQNARRLAEEKLLEQVDFDPIREHLQSEGFTITKTRHEHGATYFVLTASRQRTTR